MSLCAFTKNLMAVAAIIGSASVANAAGDTIKEIEFSGLSGADLNNAQSLIATKVGSTLNDQTQRDDIERLYMSGNYSPDITVTMDEVQDGVKLIYHVQPCPKVGSISVGGNSQIDSKKILSEMPVKEGDPYSAITQDRIVTSLQKLYEEKGYSDAMVMVKEYPSGSDKANLDIVVDEGTRQQVKSVRIEGNRAFTDLRLKMSAETKGSWFTFKRWFNQSKFDQDIEKLRVFYVSQGYLDAVVQPGQFEYAADNSWVIPVINVTEGPRYTVGRVDVRGCSVFDSEEALKLFRELAGKSYNAKEFARSVERLKKKYANEGYLTTSVEPEFHKDASRGQVDLDAVVSEGSRIYVGSVRVISRSLPDDKSSALRKWYSRFTPPPSDDVVAREVKLKPGQVYRRYDEVRTRDTLESMRVFQEVKVYDEATADPNVRNMVVDTLTGDTGKTLIGVGFGDVEGLFAYVSYLEHNMFGDATDVGLSAMVGTSSYSADLSVLRRHIMDSDWDARYNLYYRHQNRTGDVKESRLGNSVEFSKPISDSVDHAIRLRLDALSYSVPNDPTPASAIDDYIAATVGYRITKRTTDDRIMPTTGYIASGTFETGAAKGFLAKATGSYTRYFDVSNNWTVMSNSMAGFMPVDAKNVGYSDRFFMGGSRDLRGFKLYGAGPMDEDNSNVPIGGSIKLLTQLEARRRITDNFTLLGFADAGILGEKVGDLNSPRMATGIGARLRLPVATVGLDLGVPVLKKSDDQTQIVHFNMSSGM